MSFFTKILKNGNSDNDNIEERLEYLYEKGNELEHNGQYDEALQIWQDGLSLITNSGFENEATMQFLAGIGDIYFLRKHMYEKALPYFNKAKLYGGYENPFIMLRLGECYFEIGDKDNATEYLLRAFMMEDEEIFEPDENGEDDGQKYLAFLRSRVDLDKGNND